MKQKLLIIKKQATKRKNNWNFFLRNTCKLNKSNYLCTRNQEITDSQIRIDSLAQQVEHNTFNVGVLGSSPRRITENKRKIKQIPDNQTLSGIYFFWQVAEKSRFKHIIPNTEN